MKNTFSEFAKKYETKINNWNLSVESILTSKNLEKSHILKHMSRE